MNVRSFYTTSETGVGRTGVESVAAVGTGVATVRVGPGDGARRSEVGKEVEKTPDPYPGRRGEDGGRRNEA